MKSERYKQSNIDPKEVEDFTQRLTSVDLPDSFSGEKKEGKEGIKSTDIAELDVHLQALNRIFSEKDISPKYTESGEFLRAGTLREYFKKALFQQEFAPATIFRVLTVHIRPIEEHIADLTGKIKKREDAEEHNSGAFASILQPSDDQDDNEKIIDELKKKRNDAHNTLIALMKQIIENPDDFELVKKELYAPNSVEMSPSEFADRLANKPYTNLFVKDGVELGIEAQKNICKRYLGTESTLKGESAKEARNLVVRFCINPLLNRKYDILKDKEQYNRSDKDAAFAIIDAEIGEFLNSLENEDILRAYAMLIDEGVLPEGVSIEDLPVDFPVLREREPDKLKRELQAIKDTEERVLHRLNHHRERIVRMSPEDLQERVQLIKDGNEKNAEYIFSTEVGIMPMYRILAFVEYVIKDAWGEEYDEELLFDFSASVLSDINRQYHQLIQEEHALNRKDDNYNVELRGIKRRQIKLLEGLVKQLAQWIDEENRYTAAMEVEGSSGGRLAITFKPD